MTCDLRLSFNANKSIAITMSAAAIATKFHGCEYIEFAISGSRLYFRESDSRNGYKLSHGEGSKAGKAQVKNDDLAEYMHKYSHFREANLKYDSINELYFADASKRDLDWKGV